MSHGSCCAANFARKDGLKSAASLSCHARARRPSPEAYLTALEQDNHFAVIEMWARDIEVYAIHPARVAGSRDHRRAKTDRLDTELLMRAFLGWLRGENCAMAAIRSASTGHLQDFSVDHFFVR